MHRWLCFVLFFLLSPALMSQQTPVPVGDEPHHHVVLKNDFVLVTHVTLSPGDTTLFHTHSHDRVAVELTDATITQQKPGKAEGEPEPRKTGDVSALQTDAPYTHRVHNVGTTVFEVLDVELLQRPREPASTVAAKVEAENPSARVYQWMLAPGTTSAMHAHDRPYLIIAATPLTLKMTDPQGKSFTHEVKAGDLHWIDAKVTHSLANEGKTAGEIVEIELK